MDTTEIRQWIESAKQGDDKAFDELVLTYYEKVYRLCYNILKNEEDAKEVSQQTWVKIWKKLDTFRGTSAFYTWAYRIATFTAWDFIRKRKRKSEVEYLDEMEADMRPDAGLVGADIPRPDELLARAEIRETFMQALDKLSPNHRTALYLREVEGMSYEEIAESMDCAKGTVMSRLFNARKVMQQYLKDFR